MQEHYKGTLTRMQELDDIISTNCNWPSNGTTHWANGKETVDSGVFSITTPQGSHGFTKEQMNSGVSDTIYTDVEFPESGEP